MAKRLERILVVDDEPKIVEVVTAYLVLGGYDSVSAATGAQALALYETVMPCLVILDLVLPDMPGEEVCRKLRRRSRVPIIMLTAKITDDGVQEGLSMGADDYITKPFSPPQLMARVEAVLRRTRGSMEPLARQLSFGDGDLVLDSEEGEVRKAGKTVHLTPREVLLLRLLASNPGRIFSREELVACVLGEDYGGFDRTIDAHVKNLRQKIERDPHEPHYLVTVHGLGYKFGK
jgi:DNA-binding response OmpR family regulator